MLGHEISHKQTTFLKCAAVQGVLLEFPGASPRTQGCNPRQVKTRRRNFTRSPICCPELRSLVVLMQLPRICALLLRWNRRLRMLHLSHLQFLLDCPRAVQGRPLPGHECDSDRHEIAIVKTCAWICGCLQNWQAGFQSSLRYMADMLAQ